MPATRHPRSSKGLGFFAKLLLGAACAAVVLLWVSAASVYLDPGEHPWAAAAGLAFPFLLGGAVFLIFLCVLFATRRSWIPLVGLLFCAGSIRTYCPLNFAAAAPEGSLKVLTFNTCGWGTYLPGEGESTTARESDCRKTAEYIAAQDADIVCLQESFVLLDTDWQERIVDPILRKRTPYADTVLTVGRNKVSLYSKYPILCHEQITYFGTNVVGAFWLDLGKGDTLIVVNVHLKSMGLSMQDRADIGSIVEAPEQNVSESAARGILHKIGRNSAIRSRMVAKVCAFLERNAGKSVLVCGDFNDTPISYSRQRIGRGLTDAYVASGNGPGWSFNQNHIFVRIDHAFCSPDWEPYEARVDRSIHTSDHYPLLFRLQRKIDK